jgi:hypothetical protein
MEVVGILYNGQFLQMNENARSAIAIGFTHAISLSCSVLLVCYWISYFVVVVHLNNALLSIIFTLTSITHCEPQHSLTPTCVPWEHLLSV